jgi:predicted AlkP superfamily phosphohydrolase/phosphomutase
MEAKPWHSSSDRLLIIGWDGADWEILDDLIQRGLLPNFKGLLDNGLRADLMSTVPSHSWAAWSSFLTGVNPGRHGVFDFVERNPADPSKRIPVSSASIRERTFVDLLSEAGHELRVGNVPVTFPPAHIRGRMISGVAIPRGTPFVYPSDWADELQRRAPFPINGMEPTRFKDRPESLVREARRFVEERSASFELLLQGEWRVAVCVYVATDRLQHPFGAYLLPSHPDHRRLSEEPLADAIRGVYMLLDQQIEKLRSVAGPDVTVVLMSDHGFRPMSREISLAGLLGQLGLWTPSRSRSAISRLRHSKAARMFSKTRLGLRTKRTIRPPSAVNWSRTKAYPSATGGGVSVNLRGREPNGIVREKDLEGVLSEVQEALLGYQDPETGTKPITGVHRKEELYEGAYLDIAPDLMVTSNDQWGFAKGKGWTGEHRRRGILAASGGRVSRTGALGQRRIEDVAATALAFCGVDSAGLDGHAIEEVSGRFITTSTPASESGHQSTATELSEEQNQQIAQHLRELGYIE